MPYIGFRATKALSNALETVAKNNKQTKSEVVRAACEQFVFNTTLNPEEREWKTAAWTFFGVDLHKIAYALTRSESPEEFFGYMDKWTRVNMKVQGTRDTLLMAVEKGTISFTIEIPKDGTKETVIRRTIWELDRVYLEKASEDFPLEEDI